jgi:hypothetical protein
VQLAASRWDAGNGSEDGGQASMCDMYLPAAHWASVSRRTHMHGRHSRFCAATRPAAQLPHLTRPYAAFSTQPPPAPAPATRTPSWTLAT